MRARTIHSPSLLKLLHFDWFISFEIVIARNYKFLHGIKVVLHDSTFSATFRATMLRLNLAWHVTWSDFSHIYRTQSPRIQTITTNEMAVVQHWGLSDRQKVAFVLFLDQMACLSSLFPAFSFDHRHVFFSTSSVNLNPPSSLSWGCSSFKITLSTTSSRTCCMAAILFVYRTSLPSKIWTDFWEGVARKIDRDPVTRANFFKIRHFVLKVFETISKTRNALPSKTLHEKSVRYHVTQQSTFNATLMRENSR